MLLDATAQAGKATNRHFTQTLLMMSAAEAIPAKIVVKSRGSHRDNFKSDPECVISPLLSVVPRQMIPLELLNEFLEMMPVLAFDAL